MHRNNGLNQSRLGIALRLRRCLQILVGHTEIAVPQVIADRQLMLTQFCQQRPNGMPKRVPANAGELHARVREVHLLREIAVILIIGQND